MGAPRTRHLPAPLCWRCEQRIGYNQRSAYDRNRGWHHAVCTYRPPLPPGRMNAHLKRTERRCEEVMSDGY